MDLYGRIVAKLTADPPAGVDADYVAGFVERHDAELRHLALPRLATLFSGGGLVEVGLAGLARPVFAVDFDPEVAAAYRAAHGPHVVLGDVRTVKLPKPGDIEALHASPVCKTFSKARRLDAEDRGDVDLDTARATARAIRRLRPAVFTLENVPEYGGTAALDLVLAALKRERYTVDVRVYEAADYGAATRRKRLLLRAVRSGALPPVPAPLARRAGWYAAVADLVGAMPDAEVPGWMRDRLALEGIDPDHVDRPLLVLGGSAGKNVPLAWASDPAPTIKATHHEAHKVILPRGVVKRLTPRGMARITGLPDDYPLPASVRVATTIIGNGVPPALVRAVFGPLLTGRSFFGPLLTEENDDG